MLIVIRRCPSCPIIKSHMEEIQAGLFEDLHIDAVIQNGDPGEFAIFVNGLEVLRRDSNSLPDLKEIEKAVSGATRAVA